MVQEADRARHAPLGNRRCPRGQAADRDRADDADTGGQRHWWRRPDRRPPYRRGPTLRRRVPWHRRSRCRRLGVDVGHLGFGHLGTGRIGTGRIGTGHIGTGRIGTGRIGTGHIGTGRLGSRTFGTGRISAPDVSAPDISAPAVMSVGSGWSEPTASTSTLFSAPVAAPTSRHTASATPTTLSDLSWWRSAGRRDRVRDDGTSISSDRSAAAELTLRRMHRDSR